METYNPSEIEKFKSSLKGQEAKAGAATDLYKARLSDAEKSMREEEMRAKQEARQTEDTLAKDQASQQ